MKAGLSHQIKVGMFWMVLRKFFDWNFEKNVGFTGEYRGKGKNNQRDQWKIRIHAKRPCRETNTIRKVNPKIKEEEIFNIFHNNFQNSSKEKQTKEAEAKNVELIQNLNELKSKESKLQGQILQLKKENEDKDIQFRESLHKARMKYEEHLLAVTQQSSNKSQFEELNETWRKKMALQQNEFSKIENDLKRKIELLEETLNEKLLPSSTKRKIQKTNPTPSTIQIAPKSLLIPQNAPPRLLHTMFPNVNTYVEKWKPPHNFKTQIKFYVQNFVGVKLDVAWDLLLVCISSHSCAIQKIAPI